MNDRLIRQRAFFFGMVAILAVLTLILVWQFTKAILVALALVIILKPMYTWFLQKKWIKGSATRATGMTMFVFVLIIAIPAILIIGGAINQAARLFSGLNIEGLDFSIRGIISTFEKLIQGTVNVRLDEIRFGETISSLLVSLGIWVRGLLISLGQSLPRFFMNAMVVLVLMYVLLSRYKAPGKQEILEIVPFPPEITQLFLDKIDLMIKAMFKGTFVIAITQGLAMGLVLWIAGVPFIMLLTLLSMFLSLIPLIGISLVAWPIGIMLILTGQVWQGIFVIVAFVLLVANIDTILRPTLVPKGAQLNPALVILSVLGGLGVMGLIGALYGPVVMILLVTSIDVYTKYILRDDLEALEKGGRIDLKELGLESQDDKASQNIGSMVFTVMKNVTAPFRREAAATVQKPDSVSPSTTAPVQDQP